MRSARLIIGLWCLAAPLAAQTSNCVVRLGRDTVALERVTRTSSMLTGDLFHREPVEKFTITVVSLGSGGEIHFDWDKTRWVLPFTVK